MKRLLCRLAEVVFLSWPLCGWPLYHWDGLAGCCGCGKRFASVLVNPRNGMPFEHWCQRCADEGNFLPGTKVLSIADRRRLSV